MRALKSLEIKHSLVAQETAPAPAAAATIAETDAARNAWTDDYRIALELFSEQLNAFDASRIRVSLIDETSTSLSMISPVGLIAAIWHWCNWSHSLQMSSQSSWPVGAPAQGNPFGTGAFDRTSRRSSSHMLWHVLRPRS